MFIVILFCSIIIHLSFEECSDKKVSITIDLVPASVLLPLEDASDQLLWHVAILKQEESKVKFLCSGTVVGHSHVLTAASCVGNVRSSDVRVVASLTLLRSPRSVFTVTKKYFRHHRGDFDRDDLVILKLENKAIFKAPQLAILEANEKYTKQCLTLGWGIQNQLSDILKCPNPSFQDSVRSMLHRAEQSKTFLNKILDIRNFMGLSSMLIFQLSKILDIFPGLSFHRPWPEYAQDVTCPLDEGARAKAVRMSTKHPFKCLSQSSNQIHLFSTGVDNIVQKVDVGSPVFCKLKRTKSKARSVQTNSSKFVLAGVITNKKTEEVRWLKYGSSINMITATNVTSLNEFILAVMFESG